MCQQLRPLDTLVGGVEAGAGEVIVVGEQELKDVIDALFDPQGLTCVAQC